jgi:hypothetical protein
MKTFCKFLLSLALISLFTACTAEQFSRAVYEGSMVHNQSLKPTPSDLSRGEPMSYDQYERERQSVSVGRSK